MKKIFLISFLCIYINFFSQEKINKNYTMDDYGYFIEHVMWSNFYFANDYLLWKGFGYSFMSNYAESLTVHYTEPNYKNQDCSIYFYLGENCEMKVEKMHINWHNEELYTELLQYCQSNGYKNMENNSYCDCEFMYKKNKITFIFKKNKQFVEVMNQKN